MGIDWNGNNKTAFVCNSANNHSNSIRAEHDYYATDPRAVEMLLDMEQFSHNIWECACGEGHISNVLISHGYDVYSTDLIYRGFGTGGIDFLKCTKSVNMDIVTNPPYKFAKQFVEHAIEAVTPGHKIAMFLKLTFLETNGRRELFQKYPPSRVYVSSSRLSCGRNGIFNPNDNAVSYCWYIWENGFQGIPELHWFN